MASDSAKLIRSGTDTGHGHDRWTMLGLAAWINSAIGNSLIDAQLGSTQLNADDLTSLSAPSIGDLRLIALRRPALRRTGKTTSSDLLEHTMDGDTLRAARTIERLRRVRQRLRSAARTRYELREDTTALTLMTMSDLGSVAADGIGTTIMQTIEQSFGRHLDDNSARHVGEVAVPWTPQRTRDEDSRRRAAHGRESTACARALTTTIADFRTTTRTGVHRGDTSRWRSRARRTW